MRYSPFRHIGSVFWKSRPIQLTYFLTRKCNARCPFCFYLSRSDADSQGPELTLEEIERVSSSLGGLLWLAFSGGEPFLRDDIVEIAGIFYRNNRPSFILLPTNGLLPDAISRRTEEILRRCPRSTVAVKLSLDGPEEVHDKLRCVPGAYRKVLETYQGLKGLLSRYANFELGFNSVLCATNQDRMPELIDLVRKLGPGLTHTVSLVRGRVRDGQLKDVDEERYRLTAELLAKDLGCAEAGTYRFRGSRLKAAQDIVQRRMIYRTMTEKRRLVPCTAGRLTLVMTETGDVYPCESFDRKVGNLREGGYDIPSILRTPEARAAIRNIRESGCHCTHECYMMMNVLFNPRLYPALGREYLRLGPAHGSKHALSGSIVANERV
jgi:radical SAM protein with 4Fe4S-binding SPASM domain